MTTVILHEISEILGEIGTRGVFSAKQTRLTDDLHLEVKGVGRIQFPVPPEQAALLCEIGRPARYGQKEKTLLDRTVRDTWQIPKRRVKIDQRQWKRTLQPVLERIRAELGLPEGGRLKAEWHAMLVYAPGQFFLPHQDSEKSDGMLGTLVVTLPSSFRGGALVVEHQGQKATYRGSKKRLSFVAFYADCRHEVRPVKQGYRIALTYNLMFECDGASGHSGDNEAEPATVAALAQALNDHFETPIPSDRKWDQDAPPREPPNRLVYLLDHQYTERGFGWQRLKGNDVARAAALEAAAERTGCERMLALAEVHETWSCMEPDWRRRHHGYGYGEHRHWQRNDEDDWIDEDPPPDNDPDAYDLEDRIDADTTLTSWIDASGAKIPSIVAQVTDDEICATTPSSSLEAYESEYEGYMGNYGNTMDRWYRRAAIVLWPRKRAFAVRAESSPAWALDTLRERLGTDSKSDVQAMAKSLQPFWAQVASQESRSRTFGQALVVAEGLQSPALAASLLGPFRLEALTTGQAPAFAALVGRYGVRWAEALLAAWASHRQDDPKVSRAWFGVLPRVSKSLCKHGAVGQRCAKMLVKDRWRWLKEGVATTVRLDSPSTRSGALTALEKPIFGILESAEISGEGKLRDQAVAFFCAEKNEPLLPCLMRVLRAAAKRKTSLVRASPGLATIRQHCAQQLAARLASPARERDDWSMTLDGACSCAICAKLRTFLSHPATQQLDWPLAKAGRQHVHQTIDRHELPVSHKTRREGSPYTLVLRKSKALFDREAKERRAWQTDLDWLT